MSDVDENKPLRSHDVERSLTRTEAIEEFRKLTRQYGVHWTASVPASAFDRMSAVNRVLSESDRRDLLGTDLRSAR